MRKNGGSVLFVESDHFNWFCSENEGSSKRGDPSKGTQDDGFVPGIASELFC